MKYNLDYFKRLNYTSDVCELPEAIKVHVNDGGAEYDFAIKFIWEHGVGFPETVEGSSWCYICVGSVMTMPDGAELIMGNPGEFIKEVFNWFKLREYQKVKLVSDEVEFMDI